MKSRAVFGSIFAVGILFACAPQRGPFTDIRGAMPDLEFAMQRANDGETVDAKDYRGHVVVLYFGYTNCPDICPTTLSDLASVLQRLGPQAHNVRVLFVTVDPARDELPALKTYVNAFAPEIDGLRGSPDAIARLARRYRVTYAVTPASPGHTYDVMHSDSVFFFDRDGHARCVTTSVANTGDTTAAVKTLLQQ
jgi:protein SCO1/2